jgi:hypothetical protein
MFPYAGMPRNESAASTIYVDVGNTSGIEDGTQEHPYNTITEGLGVALNGDTVRVAAGTYKETISLKDGVKLRGAGPQITTIDGEQKGSVVTAKNTGPGTSLAGFSIINGTGSPEGGYTYGGGFYVLDANLVIQNCILTGNRSTDGAGGIQARDSTLKIENCRFTSNFGWWGGSITLVGTRPKSSAAQLRIAVSHTEEIFYRRWFAGDFDE